MSDVFVNPQSQIARELILPQSRTVMETKGGRLLRIIFHGEASSLPVVSNLVLECQVPVNIMFADTKDIDGAAYGHMILELPTDPRQAEKVIAWLNNNQIGWREEGK